MLRPGTKYLSSSKSDAAAKFIPFVFSADDKAKIEVTNTVVRVWVSDAVITRTAVSSATTNGSFNADVASWTDADEAGGTSVWVVGGYMGLTGNGTAAAKRQQTVTVSASDQNVEHGLKIVIQRGPVVLRVGSTVGGDEYITETTLGTGMHSLALTPTGNFTIEFSSRLKRQVLVDSCNVEAAGAMELACPWLTANLDDIRYDESADIVYVADGSHQQQKIERRATRSWSVVLYQPEDGPFRVPNVGPVTITPSALTGNVTLTASAALFRSTHVGALFSLASNGQAVTASVTAANQFTGAIKVTGAGTERSIGYSITDVWVATVTGQRSLVSESGPWTDVFTKTAVVLSALYTDGLDNQVAWYRIGVKTGDFTSGTVAIELSVQSGSINGVTRITAVASSTSASAEVISDLGSTSATDDWAEGAWSDFRGWPSAVGLAEGRLTWAGRAKFWATISDGFESFDDTVEGDSGPFSRSIGSGPVDSINWILPLRRILFGGGSDIYVGKSSSLDEIVTPTNFNIKSTSSYGSTNVQAVRIDKMGVYAQNGGIRVNQLALEDDLEYGSSDLTLFVPEIGEPGIVRMAVQRKPDTRVHCVRSDGTVAILLFDKAENLICWFEDETDGEVEDVVILPAGSGDTEDAVYYHTKRTINGSTKRYLEKHALESECQGGTTNKQADCHLVYSGTATATITGLSHLEGETVVVWGAGKDLGTFTVSGGQITGLSESVTSAIVGLGYTAQYKSTKLSYSTGRGSTLLQTKKIARLGVILTNTHFQGLKYGPTFNDLDDMPRVENGAAIAADTVHSSYDEETFPFDGRWDTDSRLCLQAAAPRPCTILAAVVDLDVNK